MTRTLTLMAAAALTGLMPSASGKADPYSASVLRQLARFQNDAVIQDNFSDRGQHVGKLRMGHRYTRPMTLERGEQYVFHAVCDQDCGHIRLRIVDENNLTVSESTSNKPYVLHSPDRTQVYRVQVDMTGCREEECHFGVGLAAK